MPLRACQGFDNLSMREESTNCSRSSSRAGKSPLSRLASKSAPKSPKNAPKSSGNMNMNCAMAAAVRRPLLSHVIPT